MILCRKRYVGHVQVHESTQQARRRLLEVLDVDHGYQFTTGLTTDVSKFGAKFQACWVAMLRNLEKCQLMILCPANVLCCQQIGIL